MYSLQKYRGPSTRHSCPQCGRPRCFTRYVDEDGQALHETVGICDHASSCGYHYTPKQFFADHPDQKPGPDWRYQRLPVTPGPDRVSHPCHSEAKPKNLFLIPDTIVRRSVRLDYDSDLITFLRTFLDPVVLEGLICDYRIGVTKSRATIFFQIDIQGRCRTGKIMMYNPETGHRIKDPDVPGRVTWVHSVMKKAGQLPADWELSQCLFGEHLLTLYPGKPVGLVESEKTAVIAAGLMPKYIWLATGGKSGLNERLRVLQGRKVVAWPDVDGFEEWSAKLAGFEGLDITVSSLLQQVATPEDFAAHIDIADWLIRCHSERSEEYLPRQSRSFLRASRFLSEDCRHTVEALIEELELEFWGAEKIYPPPEESLSDAAPDKKND